jgi:hypothetical protein
VRLLRQLALVVLVVAVIVGLGMLWARASGSGLRPPPAHDTLRRLHQVKAGVIRAESGDGFHLADTGDLIRTCVIEALLAAVVILISAARRRRTRRRPSHQTDA